MVHARNQLPFVVCLLRMTRLELDRTLAPEKAPRSLMGFIKRAIDLRQGRGFSEVAASTWRSGI